MNDRRTRNSKCLYSIKTTGLSFKKETHLISIDKTSISHLFVFLFDKTIPSDSLI